MKHKHFCNWYLLDDDEMDIFLIKEAIQHSSIPVDLRTCSYFNQLDELLKNQHLPHVIIIDYHLPRENGIEVLGKLHSEPELHHIPIVMLTTNSDDIYIEESKRLGASIFFTKPSSIHECEIVVENIYALCNKNKQQASA